MWKNVTTNLKALMLTCAIGVRSLIFPELQENYKRLCDTVFELIELQNVSIAAVLHAQTIAHQNTQAAIELITDAVNNTRALYNTSLNQCLELHNSVIYERLHQAWPIQPSYTATLTTLQRFANHALEQVRDLQIPALAQGWNTLLETLQEQAAPAQIAPAA